MLCRAADRNGVAHRLLRITSAEATQMQPTIDWFTRASDEVLAFLPKLVAGLVILIIGYIIGLLLEKGTTALARRLGFDGFMVRLGLTERPGAKTPSQLLGIAVFVVVIIATLMQASRVWDLTFVADGLARIIAFLPHVLAAAIVFALALFLGNFARDRMSRRPGAEPAPDGVSVLPAAVRAGILAIGSFMALRELQIAPVIVSAAFISTVAGIALATALAFGLGARDVAGRIARSWYERRRPEEFGNAPRVINIPTTPERSPV
jgi:hypothetical protein